MMKCITIYKLCSIIAWLWYILCLAEYVTCQKTAESSAPNVRRLVDNLLTDAEKKRYREEIKEAMARLEDIPGETQVTAIILPYLSTVFLASTNITKESD